MIAAMNGGDWVQIITAIGVVAGVLMAKFDAIAATRARDKLAKVTDAKLEAVHGLVNSAMSAQLKTNASLARRVSDLTREPADKQVAEEAEQASLTHEAAQRDIDTKKKADLDLVVAKIQAEARAIENKDAP